MRLKNKKVIVTGASKNIGAGIAQRFAEEGAEVVLHYFKDEKGVIETKKKVGSAGHILQGDFSTGNNVEDFVKKALKILGRIDVLVNCAADYDTSHFLELPRKRLDSLLSVGVISPVHLMQMVAKEMIKQEIKGSFVNISSISGLRTSANRCAHSTAKAALNMATKSAALDLGEYGIRANAICPGSVPYEGGGEYKDGGQVIKRTGTAEDIANAALFLASDEASWITGHIMVVDGGHTLSLSFS